MADQGHENLIKDLNSLLLEAELYQFHDFKNVLYAAPKIELRNKLLLLAEKVVDGEYDNSFS